MRKQITLMIFLILIISGCSSNNIQNDSKEISGETPVPSIKSTTSPEVSPIPIEDQESTWFPRPKRTMYAYKWGMLMASSFIDSENGWSINRINNNDVHDYYLYKTSNSKDWNEVTKFNMGSMSMITGISVLNEEEMWITGHFVNEDGTSDQSIYSSKNGGVSWEKQVLPHIPNTLSDPSYVSRSIWFFDKKNGMLLLELDAGESKYLYMYTTSDAGRSWSEPVALEFYGEPQLYIYGDFEWEFQYSSTIRVSIGSMKWETTDRGETWNATFEKYNACLNYNKG